MSGAVRATLGGINPTKVFSMPHHRSWPDSGFQLVRRIETRRALSGRALSRV